MRSVNVERKSRGRTQAPRPVSARGKRDLPSVQPGSVRRGKDSGAMGDLGARLSLLARRPITMLCGLLVLLVLLYHSLLFKHQRSALLVTLFQHTQILDLKMYLVRSKMLLKRFLR